MFQQEDQQPHPDFVIVEGDVFLVVDNSDFNSDYVIKENYDN